LADELTGKQRRHLRALGHHLDPVVQVGHGGINEAVVREADAQLEVHELIKVKIGESSPQARHEAAELLAGQTGAQIAQVLGRTALLYRRRKDYPQIVLPG
jgi:RNA-binding protein